MTSQEPAVSSEGVDLVADRLAGTLLGVALGDALGLPCEGMSAVSIARRFGTVDRFRLLGRTGFVSDDTEQTALIAQSLVRHPRDPDACVRAFRLAARLVLPVAVGRRPGDRAIVRPHCAWHLTQRRHVGGQWCGDASRDRRGVFPRSDRSASCVRTRTRAGHPSRRTSRGGARFRR